MATQPYIWQQRMATKDVVKFILDKIKLHDAAHQNDLSIIMNKDNDRFTPIKPIINTAFQDRIEMLLCHYDGCTSDTYSQIKDFIEGDMKKTIASYHQLLPQNARNFMPELYQRYDKNQLAFQYCLDVIKIVKDATPAEKEYASLCIAEMFITGRLDISPKWRGDFSVFSQQWDKWPASFVITSETTPQQKSDILFARAIGAIPYILPYDSESANRLKNIMIRYLHGTDQAGIANDKLPPITPARIVMLMACYNPETNESNSYPITTALWEIISNNAQLQHVAQQNLDSHTRTSSLSSSNSALFASTQTTPKRPHEQVSETTEEDNNDESVNKDKRTKPE